MWYRASCLLVAASADYMKPMHREAHPHQQPTHHSFQHHKVKSTSHATSHASPLDGDTFDRISGGGGKQERHQQHRDAHRSSNENLFQEVATPPGVVRMPMRREHNLKSFSTTSVVLKKNFPKKIFG